MALGGIELGTAYISILPETSKIAPALSKATGSAADSSGDAAGQSFGSRFSGAAGRALKTAGKAGLLAGGAAAGAVLVGGFKSAVDQAQSEKTLAGLYGSAKKAEKIMADLADVSKSSPIDYTSYAKTAETLAYMGVKAKDSAPMLENMGKMIIGAGGGSAELERAGDALVKMVNSGKVYAADLNQLSDTGLPVFSSLAAHFGTSIKNVRKMVSDGKVGIEDVQAVMMKATGATAEKQVAASEEVNKTLSNQYKMLKDNVVRSTGSALRSLETFGAKGLAVLNGLFDGGSLGGGAKFGRIFAPIKNFFGYVKRTVAPLVPVVKGFFGHLASAAKSAASGVLNILRSLQPLGSVLKSIAALAFEYTVKAIGVALRLAGPAVDALASGFSALGKWMANNKGLVSTLAGAFVAYKAAVLGVVAAKKAWTIAVAAWRAIQVAAYAPMAAWTAATYAFTAAKKAYTVAVSGGTKAQVANTAAQKAGIVVGKAVRVATLAWAGAQRVLNAVMKANPILRIVGLLTLLGTGLVLAYKKSATFRKIVDGAWSGIKKAAEASWKFLRKVFSGLGKAFSSIVGWLKRHWRMVAILAGPLGIAVALITKYWGKIKSVVSAAWSKVLKPTFGLIGKILRGDVAGAFDAVKGVATRVLGAIVGAVKSVPGQLLKAAGAFLNAGKGLIGALFDGMKKVGGGAASIAKSIANTFIGFLNTVIDKINGMLEIKMPGPVPDLNPPDIPNIPKFARGGRVTSATYAMIGEGREPESVLPDSVLRGLLTRAHRNGANGDMRKVLARLTRVLDRVAGALRSGSGRGKAARDGVTGPSFTPKSGSSKKMLEGFKKGTPILKGFDKSIRRTAKSTIGMEYAVGKSAKTMGRHWTALRKGPVRAFSKDYDKRTRQAEKDTIRLQKLAGRQTTLIGKDFLRFRKGSLKGFASDWRQRMARDAPKDMGTFRSKTLGHFRDTRSGMAKTWRDGIRPVMRDFGRFPRHDVAPMFRDGTKLIGDVWKKVVPRTGRPVSATIAGPINKGLVKAFNKIAAFVGGDKFKKLDVPKFDVGGWTGAGPRMKPAGVVHADEFVVNKPSRRKFERKHPGALDFINQHGDLPGYWTGGGVMPLPSATSISQHPTPYYGAWYAADMNGPYDGTMRAGIVSWKDGRVAYTKQRNSSYGYETVINHADGNFTRYAHQLPGSQVVSAGQAVRAGQRIGAVGETGNAHGAHLHFEIKGGAESAIQGLTGAGGPTAPKWVLDIIDAPKKWAKGLLQSDALKGTGFGEQSQGFLNKLTGPIAAWAEDKLGPAAYSGPMSGNVMRFVPIVKKVLAALGEKAGPTLVDAIMARMQKESGGNVGIVNNWDSNAAAGHPSVGLMQVIGPTYQANKPTPDRGPYKYGTSIDPYSNIYAGLHYARGRYGSIYAGMTQPGGYQNGGWLQPGELGFNETSKPEMVFNLKQWHDIRRAARAEGSASAGGPQRITGTLDISPNGRATIRGWAAQEMGSQQAYARNVSRMG